MRDVRRTIEGKYQLWARVSAIKSRYAPQYVERSPAAIKCRVKDYPVWVIVGCFSSFQAARKARETNVVPDEWEQVKR